MSENPVAIHKSVRIGLLGAAFDTGNMGVSALAESAIKCILHWWPDAEITLLDSGRVVGEEKLRIGDNILCIKKLPVRLCRNIFLENHFVVLCFYAILFKLFSWERFKRFCTQRNASVKCIVQIDIVADITGGDSFSDIYGMRRFVLGFLRKWLVLLFNKDLVMLPQTYGPFKRRVARAMARYILNRAKLIYSRDRSGVEYVNALLGNCGHDKVRFIPDVAFVLDTRRPDNRDMDSLERIRASNKILVGLNVSGLLFNGGYTRDDMFALNVNYGAIVYDIIDLFMKHEKVSVLLVSHVFTAKGHVENDQDACLAVYEALRDKYEKRVFVIHGQYDQGEIKYIIGMCDFFVGSRMHACIAALSQGIPAIGIAYSKKFTGVFESIGLSDCVVDVRTCTESELPGKIWSSFEKRELIRNHLQNIIPSIKREVLNMFKDLEL